MKRILTLLIAGGSILIAAAQPTQTKDVVVRAWAEITNGSPPTITLRWNAFPSSQQITIWKKEASAVDWTFVANIPAGDTSYVTKKPKNNTATEWRVQKDIYINGMINNYGNGYVYAGVRMAEEHSRGRLLMLIAQNANDSLATDIGLAMRDMTGDGWIVDSLVIPSTDNHFAVKAKIRNWYNSHSDAKSLFIFGHVAVPYSGNMRNGGFSVIPADGHTPDHDGAWPSDVYYADMDTSGYTDAITNTTGTRAANQNVPSDGKFDQIIAPSDAELAIARVDLSSLPAFAKTEMQLLAQYLQKLHAYKTNQWNVPRRGLIDDRLGYMDGEAPGRGAWMSMSPMFRPANISTGNYYTSTKAGAYSFSHTTSFGNYNQYVDIMNTSNFNDSIKSVFNTGFGSYFGDWDNSDNILRGCLASPGYTLTNCWDGRPMFIFHHMALGKTIGYANRVTQNNFAILGVKNATYPVLFMAGRTHISMMGDPTLRLHMITPPTSLNVKKRKAGRQGLRLTWTGSTDTTILGYHIYRAENSAGPYTLISNRRIKKLSYVDSWAQDGINYYMVRAVKLDSSASGTYYNLSTGIFGSQSYLDTFSTPAPLAPAVADEQEENAAFAVYPNPASGQVTVELTTEFSNSAYHVSDAQGKVLASGKVAGSKLLLNTSAISNGIYFITFANSKKVHTEKIVIVK